MCYYALKMDQNGWIYSKVVAKRLRVPFGIHGGDSSDYMSSKEENLLFFRIRLSDPFGCLPVSVTAFSFPRCLGIGVLAVLFFLGYTRVSRISCFNFLSAFSFFAEGIPTCLVQ